MIEVAALNQLDILTTWCNSEIIFLQNLFDFLQFVINRILLFVEIMMIYSICHSLHRCIRVFLDKLNHFFKIFIHVSFVKFTRSTADALMNYHL